MVSDNILFSRNLTDYCKSIRDLKIDSVAGDPTELEGLNYMKLPEELFKLEVSARNKNLIQENEPVKGNKKRCPASVSKTVCFQVNEMWHWFRNYVNKNDIGLLRHSDGSFITKECEEKAVNGIKECLDLAVKNNLRFKSSEYCNYLTHFRSRLENLLLEFSSLSYNASIQAEYGNLAKLVSQHRVLQEDSCQLPYSMTDWDNSDDMFDINRVDGSTNIFHVNENMENESDDVVAVDDDDDSNDGDENVDEYEVITFENNQ